MLRPSLARSMALEDCVRIFEVVCGCFDEIEVAVGS